MIKIYKKETGIPQGMPVFLFFHLFSEKAGGGKNELAVTFVGFLPAVAGKKDNGAADVTAGSDHPGGKREKGKEIKVSFTKHFFIPRVTIEMEGAQINPYPVREEDYGSGSNDINVYASHLPSYEYRNEVNTIILDLKRESSIPVMRVIKSTITFETVSLTASPPSELRFFI